MDYGMFQSSIVRISQQYLLNVVWITKSCFFYNFQVYTLNKGQIDPVLDKVKPHFDEISGKLSSEISGKVFAMFPQAKAAEKTE